MEMSSIMSGIEKKASENVKAEQGDYLVDGLLYCGKCHTPKQTRVFLFNEERTPYCLCKCAVEKRDREEDERKRRDFERKVAELRRMGFPERETENWTFANDDLTNKKVSTVARNYVENFAEMRKRGKGLLLYGSVGTGKTFAAVCIANALIDKGYPCLVTSFSRVRNTLQGMFDGKQQYIDSLNRFSLLVIDDLAAEGDTEYMGEIVQTVIDSRYRAGLPLIITTNLTAQELKNPAEMRKQRIYSRLFEMCIPMEVEGKDRRKEKLKAGFAEYKGLLGL